MPCIKMEILINVVVVVVVVVTARTEGGLASRKPLLLPGYPNDDRQTSPFTK